MSSSNHPFRDHPLKGLVPPYPFLKIRTTINCNMATLQEIATIEVIIGYPFNDKTLVRQAFTAPGSHTTPNDGHRRLALLGDAVMKMALIQHWHQTPGATRGIFDFHLSPAHSDVILADGDRVLQAVATNDNLNQMGRNANLHGFIIRNPSQAPGVIGMRTMADTIEAILGAVYHDAAFDLLAVIPVMQNLGLRPV